MNSDLKNFFIKNPNHKFEVVLLTYLGRSGSFLLQSCLDKNPNILNLYPLLDRSFYIIAEKARDIPLNSFYDFFIKNFNFYDSKFEIKEIFRAGNQNSFKLTDEEKNLLSKNIQKILTEIDKEKIIYNKIQFYFNLLYVSFAQIINFKVDHNNLKLLFHPHNFNTFDEFTSCIKNLDICTHLATVRKLSDNFISYRIHALFITLESKRTYHSGLDENSIQKYCGFSHILNLFTNQITLLQLLKKPNYIKIEDIRNKSIFEILPNILSLDSKKFNLEKMSYAGQSAIWIDYRDKDFKLTSSNDYNLKKKKKYAHISLSEKKYIKFLFSDLNGFLYRKRSFNYFFEGLFLTQFLIFKFVNLNLKYLCNKTSIKENLIKTIYCIKDDLKAISYYKNAVKKFLQNEKKNN